MPNVNLGLSVFKREAKPKDQVVSQLKSDGWTETDTILGGRVTYFERSGISISVVKGPMGTVIVPSGPVRGRLFGNSGAMVNTSSVIGAGSNSNESAQTEAKVNERGGEMT